MTARTERARMPSSAGRYPNTCSRSPPSASVRGSTGAGAGEVATATGESLERSLHRPALPGPLAGRTYTPSVSPPARGAALRDVAERAPDDAEIAPTADAAHPDSGRRFPVR